MTRCLPRHGKMPRYCQNRLKNLREKDLKALGRDFLQQIADYVRKDGYDAIVWDEAGELEADKHILVMGVGAGNGFAAAAARKGHPVILAPCSHFYFDYYQSAASTEPKAVGGLIPLKQVYGYELPELSPEEAARVRGLQANIWTEYLYNMGLVNTWLGRAPWPCPNAPGATATPGTTNPSAAVPPGP